MLRTTLKSFSPHFCPKDLSTVPGMHVQKAFLNPSEVKDIHANAIGLFQTLLNPKSKSSPQNCETFLSKYHNLSSDEYYKLLSIDDKENGRVQCQHFDIYGEKGHTLTYFLGNSNIPTFLNNCLIPKVSQLPAVRELTQNKKLNWNFTFNTYAASNEPKALLPGFGFHKDIPSNGDATVIYSLGTPSIFEIRHPDKIEEVCKVALENNSLVMISKEARWDFEHRVVPIEVSNPVNLCETEVGSIKRISLVLGFRPIQE